jgi:hypothetical protein
MFFNVLRYATVHLDYLMAFFFCICASALWIVSIKENTILSIGVILSCLYWMFLFVCIEKI